ncbi:conjugative transfer protein MobI(A/C) [Salinisphaera sp. T31B1]|uniref:conjugative transfer protein MobI(A/C) n=1 Tax=Salinisphaera sp. T31B1 TaxID=727963 RepID=UPI003340FD11
MDDDGERFENGLEQMNQAALESAEALFERARDLADQFWEAHHSAHQELPKEERGFIGVRARLRNGSIQIEWFRAKYWQRRKGASGGASNKPALEYLGRGKSMRYTPKAFQRVRAKDWEIELAMRFEDQFEVIRRQSQMLGKIRRYVVEARKASARPVEQIGT